MIEAIQKVAAIYDCKLVEGVLSHQLKQFVIDGNKVVLGVGNADTRVRDAEFEENEVNVSSRHQCQSCHYLEEWSYTRQKYNQVFFICLQILLEYTLK